MSNVISSATVSVKRSVSCSVLYSVLLRKQGVATFWSFESREVESRKIGKELHDSYYLLNSDLVFFSSLSWYQSFTHSHYLLSTVKLHWGGGISSVGRVHVPCAEALSSAVGHGSSPTFGPLLCLIPFPVIPLSWLTMWGTPRFYTSITAVPSHTQCGQRSTWLAIKQVEIASRNCSQPIKTCCDTQLTSVQEIRVSQSQSV